MAGTATLVTRKRVHPERRPAVITGASSGIGAATAMALSAAGLPVVLGSRRVEKCEEVAERVRAQGGEAFAHALDITDEASVKAFARAAEEHFGGIEVVISNAGVTNPGVTHDTATDDFAADVDLNLLGAHRLVNAFVPQMVERQRGDIVFISSDVAVRARPFMQAYAASKWGLEGMVHAMQQELEGTGVRASLVRPGPTMTEMGMAWDPTKLGQVIEGWSRFGHARHDHFLKPEPIADAIASVVTAPRGVHLNLIEVSPEAPVVSTPSQPSPEAAQ